MPELRCACSGLLDCAFKGLLRRPDGDGLIGNLKLNRLLAGNVVGEKPNQPEFVGPRQRPNGWREFAWRHEISLLKEVATHYQS